MQLQFRDINIDDGKLFDKYKKNWCIENAEMTFEHLYIWGAHSFVQIAEDCDVIEVICRQPGLTQIAEDQIMMFGGKVRLCPGQRKAVMQHILHLF